MKNTLTDIGYVPFVCNSSADVDAYGLVKLNSSGEILHPAAITDPIIGALASPTAATAASKGNTVALLNKPGTIFVKQAAAIAPGARVAPDATNFQQVRTLPTSTGSFQFLGVKIDRNGVGSGSANDLIEIIPDHGYITNP